MPIKLHARRARIAVETIKKKSGIIDIIGAPNNLAIALELGRASAPTLVARSSADIPSVMNPIQSQNFHSRMTLPLKVRIVYLATLESPRDIWTA